MTTSQHHPEPDRGSRDHQALPIRRRAIARRLDAMALDQLRAEAARLAVENERLQALLATAERDAEFWWDEVHKLTEAMHDAGKSVGLTKYGEIIEVEPGQSLAEAVAASRQVTA